MNKQETINSKRGEYLDGKISHHEYYCWLSDFVGLPKGIIPFSNDEVLNSKDKEHLNDLPLYRWDNMDGIVRTYVGGLFWSLSDTVCCLKAMARRRAGL